MKAKRNRYDLSLWDVRKLQLYGRARERVQSGSQFASFGRSESFFGYGSRSLGPDY
jgi:hypothetical protein